MFVHGIEYKTTQAGSKPGEERRSTEDTVEGRERNEEIWLNISVTG